MTPSGTIGLEDIKAEIGTLSDVLSSPSSLFARLASLTGESRLYDIEVAGTSTPLSVEGFISRAELSSLPELTVLVLSTDATIDLDALQWQPVRLLLTQSDGSRITRSGFVHDAQALESDGGLARYSLRLVPWLWLLTQQTHSRIYQDKSVLEILGEVFTGYDGLARWQLAEGVQEFIDALPRRRVCSQYRETDYDFVRRLLVEEGLGFYFDEAAAGDLGGPTMLIFSDSSRFAEDLSSQSALGGTGIRFHRASSQQDQDAIQQLVSLRTLPSAALTAAAWDPDRKGIVAASLSTHRRYAGETAAVPLPALERYQWAGHGRRVTPVEIERSAQLAQEATEARHKGFVGIASVRSFQPGRHFVLTESPFDDTQRFRSGSAGSGDRIEDEDRVRFALTRVDAAGLNNLPKDLHQAIVALLGLSGADALGTVARDAGMATSSAADEIGFAELLDQARQQGYGCRFNALRSVIPWRPEGAGHPQPARAEGPQSAVVVSTGDGHPELHRDTQGRIQVRFHWQRAETPQDSSSGWVRLGSRYAGSGIGSSFVPRVGQEVLVGFLDQDIDQPIVLGALYNGRGEGGEAPTPAGAAGEAADAGLFAQAADRVASAQGNTRGGNAPAWHGASSDADGHRNAAGLSGLKSSEFGSGGGSGGGGAGYNQLQHDDHDDELRTQLASTQSASQLNLGHLIHSADNHRGSQRGSGFELRTDQSAAIRGGAGVLLTTWRSRNPGGPPEPIGDVTAPLALLNQAKGLSDAFDSASQTHQTVGLSTKRGSLKAEASTLTAKAAPLSAMVKAASAIVDADDDGKAIGDAPASLTATAPQANTSSATAAGASSPVPHLGAPMVITAAQAGLGMIAGQAVQIASGESAFIATGGDLNLAGGNQLTLHSGQAIGLLAGAAKAGQQNAGLTGIAARGPVTLQAQADTMNLDSQKALTMISANASAEFAAATSIRIATSQGASIEIEGGNIIVQCPGTLTMHAAKHEFAPGTQLSREMNGWPTTKFNDKFVLREYAGGPPVPNQKVEIIRDDGAVIRIITDGQGQLPLQQSDFMDGLVIRYLV